MSCKNFVNIFESWKSTIHAPNFVDVDEEEEKLILENQQKELKKRPFQESDFSEGDIVWSEHNDTFYLAKISKIKPDKEDTPVYVHYLHFNKVYFFVKWSHLFDFIFSATMNG